MNHEELSKLRCEAEKLFATADKTHLKANRENYMKMKKIFAALSKAEPTNPANYQWMAIANHRLGREYEALLFFDKASSLVDVSKEQPDRLTERKRDIKTLATQYILNKTGTTAHLGNCTRIAGNQWAIPVTCPWVALRGAGREYDEEISLDCGELLLDDEGHLVDDRAVQAFRITRQTYTGAFEIYKGKGCFTCVYPHRYGQLMISRLIDQSGVDRSLIREAGNQDKLAIKIGQIQVEVTDYESLYTFFMEQEAFISLLGLMEDMKHAFLVLEKPLIVIAFDKPLSVLSCVDPDNPDEVLLDPVINQLYHSEFERLRGQCVHQQDYPLETAYEFDYAKSTPMSVVKLLTATDLTHNRFEHTTFDFGTGPLDFRASHDEVQGFIESQYRALLESVWPTLVRGVFKGKPYQGHVMEAAVNHYACYFLHDAFRNTMAMSYFDSELAKEVMLTMLRYGTLPHGAFPNGKCNTTRADDCQYMLPLWSLYDRVRDKDWLSQVYDVIEEHAVYWNKFRFIKEVGLYTGSFGAPDYDYGAPGEDENVFSAGLNGSLYLFKIIKAQMARELDRSYAQDLEEASRLRSKINELLWDDEQGFYFNYDAIIGNIFQTNHPDDYLKSKFYYKLHNLIPLLGGVPDHDQAKRVANVLTDPNIYGRFRGVIEVASGSGGDERRLRVWPFFNWLVLQGLRTYGLHNEADRISADLYNMCFRAWYVYDDFPECYDATHGYLPEENPNVGGVGSISVPLLLVLDRIGLYCSTLADDPGMKIRPLKESGLGNLSFNCTWQGQPVQMSFREGQGLTIGGNS